MSSQIWFVLHNDRPVGPLSPKKLKQLAARGEVAPTSRVRLGESGAWQPAAKIKNLFTETAASQPPELPRPAAVEAAAVAPVAVDQPTSGTEPVPLPKARSPFRLVAAVAAISLFGGLFAISALVVAVVVLVGKPKSVPRLITIAAAKNSVPATQTELPAAATTPPAPSTEAASNQPPAAAVDFSSMTFAEMLEVIQDNSDEANGKTADREASSSPPKPASPDELYQRALDYARGTGVVQDRRMSAFWLEEAATAGHVEAMFDIATMYSEGDGVAADQAKAAQWFKRGAEAGHLISMHNYGWHLYNGEGVALNRPLAMEWFKKASAGGYAPSTDALVNIKANSLDRAVGAIFGGGGEDSDNSEAEYLEYMRRQNEENRRLQGR